MYKEIWFDSDLAISSATKYPSTDTPIFYFPEGFKGATRIKVLEAIIPKTWQDVIEETAIDPSSVDNPGDWTNGFTYFYAPHGHQQYRVIFYNPTNPALKFNWFFPGNLHTTQDLVDYFNNDVFNGAAPLFPQFRNGINTLTGGTNMATNSLVSIDANGRLFWQIYLVSTPGGGLGVPYIAMKFFPTTPPGTKLPFLAKIMGLNAFQTSFGSAYFDGTGVVNELVSAVFPINNPFNYLTIQSNAIGANFQCSPNSFNDSNVYGYYVQDGKQSVVAEIPSTEAMGQTTVYKDPNPDRKFTVVQDFVGQLDFFVSLGPYINDPLNFNGASFKLKVAFETLEDINAV
jgi:hypothetical protein